jgi:hypothetical protein
VRGLRSKTTSWGLKLVTDAFTDKANLDEEGIWPVDFALKRLTGDEDPSSRS